MKKVGAYLLLGGFFRNLSLPPHPHPAAGARPPRRHGARDRAGGAHGSGGPRDGGVLLRRAARRKLPPRRGAGWGEGRPRPGALGRSKGKESSRRGQKEVRGAGYRNEKAFEVLAPSRCRRLPRRGFGKIPLPQSLGPTRRRPDQGVRVHRSVPFSSVPSPDFRTRIEFSLVLHRFFTTSRYPAGRTFRDPPARASVQRPCRRVLGFAHPRVGAGKKREHGEDI